MWSRILRVALFLIFFFASRAVTVSDDDVADQPYLIDIYNPVKITVSSVLERNGMRFIPEWSIDRVSSRHGFNCFISQRERNPWWRMDLGFIREIHQIFVFRRKDDTFLPDVKISEMADVIAYVDNNPDTLHGAHIKCGETDFSSSLFGRYVHIVVDSTLDVFLAMCEIYFYIRNVRGINIVAEFKDDVFYTSELEEDPTKPWSFLLDADANTCGSAKEPTVLSEVSLHFPQPILFLTTLVHVSTKPFTQNYEVYVGSHRTGRFEDNKWHLSEYGLKDASRAVYRVSSAVFATTVNFRLRAFEPASISLCKFQVESQDLYEDIYSGVVATARNELHTSSLAMKAIDGSLQTFPHACFRSFKQANTWWRTEFKEVRKISYIVITPLPEANALREMDGFDVYVGNVTVRRPRDNVPCRLSPMVHPLSSGHVVTEMRVTCFGQPSGKFVYVVSSNRSTSPTPSLSLCEVRFYDCDGFDSYLTKTSVDTSIDNDKETIFRCSATGCPPPSIEWSRPNGGMVNMTRHDQSGVNVTSEITVRGSRIDEGAYTCTAYNGGATNSSATMNLFVYPFIITSPMNVSALPGQVVSLKCSAGGYPLPSISWTSEPEGAFAIASSSASSIAVTSTIDVVLANSSNALASIWCTASNGLAKNATVQSLVSGKTRVRVKSVYGRVGDTLSLFCNASGVEARFIEWYKGAQALNGTTFTRTPLGVESTLTLSDVQLSDGADDYYCEAGRAGYLHTISSARATVGVLGEIVSFPSQSLDRSSSTSVECTVTAAPRPTSAQVRVEGIVVANLNQTHSSTNQWMISYPIPLVTVKKGADYTCVVTMGPRINVSALAQLAVRSVLFGQPQSTLLERGLTKILTCSATGYPIPTITWQRTIGDRSTNVSASEAIDTASREKTSIVTLFGEKVDQGGVYQCRAYNSAPGDALKISLSAIVTVKPFLAIPSSSLVGIRGETASLVCQAAGTPLPTTSWSFRGQEVRFGVHETYATATISTLNRTAVDAMKDGGVYECRGQNSIGNAEPISITLKFYPHVAVGPESQEVSYGKKLVLTCLVTAYPASQFSPIAWYKNNQSVSSSLVVDWIDPENDTFIRSTLTINGTNVNDGGNYTCLDNESPRPASVIIGSRFVSDPRGAAVLEGTTVSLTCEIIGYPPGYIVWQKSNDSIVYEDVSLGGNINQVDKQISQSRQTTLTIKEIRRSNGGRYRCRSRRIYSRSAEMDVHYLPSILEDSVFGSLLLDSGSSFDMSCTGDGNPIPALHFYKTSLTPPYLTRRIQSDDVDHELSLSSDGKTATLNVSNVVTAYSGNYFCRVLNRYGHVDSGRLKIQINGPPSGIDPAVVTAIEKTTSSVTFSWAAPYDGGSAILNYTVSFKREESSSNYTFLTAVDNATFVATISRLRVFTTYLILIIPTNKLGEAQGTVPATVKTEPGVPLAPRNFTAEVWNSTSVFAQWEPPLSEENGIVRYYRVYYERVGERVSSPPYQQFIRNNTSVFLLELESYVRFILHVRSVNEWEDGTQLEGPPSGNQTVTTFEDAPTAPRNVRGVAIAGSTSTMRVVWREPDPPNGIIRKYTVYYQNKIGGVTLSKDVTGDKLSAVLDSLALYATYIIQVQAQTIKPGQLSHPVEGTTSQGLPSAPRRLAVTGNSTTTVSLEWIAPATSRGIITQYTVFYSGNKTYSGLGKKMETFSAKSSQDVRPPLTAYTVNRLAPNTEWIFSVTASTAGGMGSRSATVIGKTLATRPFEVYLPPVDPSKSTRTTATLTLIDPSEENGEIGQIDVLAASSLSGIANFEGYKGNRTYSPDLPVETIYVAASFESRQFLPTEFTLGTGQTVNGYLNGQLKSDMTYQCALRVYSAVNDSSFTISNTQTIATSGANEGDGQVCRHLLLAVGSGLGGLFLGLVVTGIVLYVVKGDRLKDSW
ncbi:cell adhesion molecule DSCAM-like isoform X2 [Oscarella lobularis]|uniref:cell adhesion molecule DSCAM-like isoform X2 n=1 Tax=Oscarella lobularis TaxID=121494 RepID=UPI003313F175